jgi:hypothetical protein
VQGRARRDPVAVGEGVELLDIAEGMVGLRLDPGAQARLQRAMTLFERAGGQGGAIPDGHDPRLAAGHRHNDRDQVGCDHVLGWLSVGTLVLLRHAGRALA